MEADRTPTAATPGIRSLLRLCDRIETTILSMLLGIMIVLSCMQILLRTFFSSGLLWADPLLRYLVLWCGMLGAVSAAGQGQHIAIDLVGRRLGPRIEPFLDLVVNIFSALTAFGLSWAGWLFLRNEMQFGETSLLSIPSWVWNTIFPLAFILIGGKYLLLTTDCMIHWNRPDFLPPQKHQ